MNYTKLTFAIAFSTVIFSCQKSNVVSPSNATLSNAIQSNESSEQSVVRSLDAAGRSKIQLRPGLTDGQDTYVAYWDGDASWANGTGDFAQELSMMRWTNNGLPTGTRSFIKFDSLVLVPSNAQVVKATLYLYAKGSSISNLNGNSIYPGSPYSGYPDNSCVVEGVTGSNWSESNLTWNTQPSVTSNGRTVIPSSTSQWAYNANVDVTAIVRKMVANPTSNFGFRLSLSNESAYRSMIFASSENADVNKRPMLVVVYK